MAKDGPIFKGFILRGGKRAHRFGEQLEIVNLKRHFTCLGAEYHALSLNEIADIKQPIEKVKAFLTDLIQTEEQLNLTCAIFDMRKRDFSHRAHRSDTSSQSELNLSSLCFSSFEFFDGFCT